jgi:hypothetical protein
VISAGTCDATVVWIGCRSGSQFRKAESQPDFLDPVTDTFVKSGVRWVKAASVETPVLRE